MRSDTGSASEAEQRLREVPRAYPLAETQRYQRGCGDRAEYGAVPSRYSGTSP
ncbi:hypothetical protein [Amycolatopsis sp. GM8]|uniref:hypothetical protein n=1 Tax=Amycolatopsis sp. GM8 TaxID=2896530 RepID=UPI001F2C07DA|nr:hypothetical protein [Amycolatopsis sp. GM8]